MPQQANAVDEATMLSLPVSTGAPGQRAGMLVVEGALVEVAPGECKDLDVEDRWWKCIRDDSIIIKNDTQFKGYYLVASYTPDRTMIKELDAKVKAAIDKGASLEAVLKLGFEFIKGDEPKPQEGSVKSGKSVGVMVPTKQAYINAWVLVPNPGDQKGTWQWLGQAFARHKTRVVFTY